MGNCKSNCNQQSVSYMYSVDCTKLKIYVKTWIKDELSLFDFDNDANFQEQTFEIKSQGYLVGRNQVNWTEKDPILKDLLCKISKKNDNYYLVNSYFMNNEQKQEFYENEEWHTIGNKRMIGKIGSKIWQVIHQNGSVLKEGDVIKLGRVKFTIRSIGLDVQNVQSIHNSESQQSRLTYQSNMSDKQMCRICCSSQQTLKNPFLNPCKCSGSIKYIHLECLKTWLRIKLKNQQSENCTVYLWKNLVCELCKFNFPSKFISDDTYYDLVELSKPSEYPYLMMEFTNKQGQQIEFNNSSGVYIVKLSNTNHIRLGRQNDTDVRINDVSVSRNHARIVINDNQVYLFDNNSKFGTQYLVREDELQISRGMQVQIGRSLIQFQ